MRLGIRERATSTELNMQYLRVALSSIAENTYVIDMDLQSKADKMEAQKFDALLHKERHVNTATLEACHS